MRSIDLLAHAKPDCTGRWERRDGFFKSLGGGWWQCTGCARQFPACRPVDAAARRENEHGAALIAADSMGRMLLSTGIPNRVRGRVP